MGGIQCFPGTESSNSSVKSPLGSPMLSPRVASSRDPLVRGPPRLSQQDGPAPEEGQGDPGGSHQGFDQSEAILPKGRNSTVQVHEALRS